VELLKKLKIAKTCFGAGRALVRDFGYTFPRTQRLAN